MAVKYSAPGGWAVDDRPLSQAFLVQAVHVDGACSWVGATKINRCASIIVLDDCCEVFDLNEYQVEVFSAVQPGTRIDVFPRLSGDDSDQEEPETEESVIEKALNRIYFQTGFGNERHLLWLIDQTVRTLTGDGYEDWVADWCEGQDGSGTYVWDQGVRDALFKRD